jgi:hypothetical protein
LEECRTAASSTFHLAVDQRQNAMQVKLYHKKIVDSPICTVCGAAEETPDHIIFHCPIALECWSAIGLPGNQNPQAQNLYCIQKLQNVPEYLMISSVRSSPFVAGKFGKEETSCIPK